MITYIINYAFKQNVTFTYLRVISSATIVSHVTTVTANMQPSLAGSRYWLALVTSNVQPSLAGSPYWSALVTSNMQPSLAGSRYWSALVTSNVQPSLAGSRYWLAHVTFNTLYNLYCPAKKVKIKNTCRKNLG